MANASAVKSSCINLGICLSLQFDAEEHIKRLVVRLAVGEKLASRIGAMRVAWSTLVVLGAFGFLINKIDFIVLSLITFAEAFRLSIREFELELQALSRELEARSKFTKADFSLLPIPPVGDAFKPELLRIILWLAEVASAVLSIALSIWRLGHHNFCTPASPGRGRQPCQLSAYLFHGMTILGSAVFLVAKGYFLLFLSSVRNRRQDHSLVFEKFSVAVYTRCLDSGGSIYDGLEMNLVVIAIQWLQSGEFEEQLRGAKLLNNLMAACHAAEHKLISGTADAVRRLGAYPGLMERLVNILSWDEEDEAELSDEVAAIICDLVASDCNCSTFAALPGALDAVMSLLVRRAEKPALVRATSTPAPIREGESRKSREKCRENCLQVLEYVASNESSSARALHKRIADFRCIIMGDSRLKSV